MIPSARFCIFITLAALASLPACNRAPSPADSTSSERLAAACMQLINRALADGAAHVTNALMIDDASICLAEIIFPGSTLRTEVRMPLSDWNARLLFLGGGGFDGAIRTTNSLQFSRSARTGGYATASTNGGYDYPDGGYDYPVYGRNLDYFEAKFAYDRRALEDFTYASEHRALPAVLAVIEMFYGRPPERRYFEGCSMGGHDALILAQRYPQDFDGIIARAPAGNIIGSMLRSHHSASVTREPGAALSGQQLERLQSAVLEQCDLDDGLRDGLVSRPLQCRFDPESLRCPAGTPTPGCFSAAQMRLLESNTAPFQVDRWQHPGFPFSGAEADPKGWPENILPHPEFGNAPVRQHFSHGFIRAFVTGDADFDTATWRAEDWLEQLSSISKLFQADDPDLSAFHARGGKLILWHGTADTAISISDSVGYYQQVEARLGTERTREMSELFLAPGVGHCSRGPGPDTIDLVQALSDWVETGTPPSRQGLVHQKFDQTGNVILERPACVWPSWPQYRGQGAIEDAESFVCANE